MDPRAGAMPMSTDRQVVVAHARQVVDFVVVVAAVDEVEVGATTQRRCSKWRPSEKIFNMAKKYCRY